MRTGLLHDERFLEHHTGPGHPERPERLEATLRHLRRQPWFDQLECVAPRLVDTARIERVHAPELPLRAERACRDGFPYLDVADVGVSERSYEIARLAAGGALELADRLMQGEIDNGFALCRPPGHHAERDMALGFCLFNNVAILARYLQEQHGLERILILDWDVHHGNGTQHTFEEDPSVLYVSLHQYPFYPGTGSAAETGVGAGLGATLNCPMRAGAGDAEYRQAFTERVLPACEAFAPDAVLVSAGFDAHAADPLANVRLSTESFGWMTERMLELADRHAAGRLISLLEGGYDLDALAQCVGLHLATLGGFTPDRTGP